MTSAEVARPSTILVVAAFAAVYVIWGSTYLAIRVAVANKARELVLAQQRAAEKALLG